VFNNQDLNMVTWEQRVLGGDPKFMGSQYLPDVPYHKWGELLGLTGIYCDRDGDVGAAWDRALAASGPTVLEFKVDREIAPLPPRIGWEQAKNFSKAMLRGDPEAFGVITKAFKGKFDEYCERFGS
jgi:pyruvate dehydrogenase (quinone)